MILTALLATSATTLTPSETAFGTIASTEVVEQKLVQKVETKKRVIGVAGSDPETESIVRSYFRDIPIMAEIARCESTFRHTLPDGSVLKGRVDSDDTGVMQINRRYHGETAARLKLNIEDLYHNMAYARHLYETQGTQPWSASAPCWNKSVAMNI